MKSVVLKCLEDAFHDLSVHQPYVGFVSDWELRFWSFCTRLNFSLESQRQHHCSLQALLLRVHVSSKKVLTIWVAVLLRL